ANTSALLISGANAVGAVVGGQGTQPLHSITPRVVVGSFSGLAHMRYRVFGTNEQLHGNCSERPEVDIPAGSGTQVPGSHPGIQCRVDQRDHAGSSNADRVQSLGVDVEETVCKLRAAGESEQQEPLVRRAKAHSDILDHVQQDLVVGGVARTQELVAIRVRAVNADWCE